MFTNGIKSNNRSGRRGSTLREFQRRAVAATLGIPRQQLNGQFAKIRDRANRFCDPGLGSCYIDGLRGDLFVAARDFRDEADRAQRAADLDLELSEPEIAPPPLRSRASIERRKELRDERRAYRGLCAARGRRIA